MTRSVKEIKSQANRNEGFVGKSSTLWIPEKGGRAKGEERLPKLLARKELGFEDGLVRGRVRHQ